MGNLTFFNEYCKKYSNIVYRPRNKIMVVTTTATTRMLLSLFVSFLVVSTSNGQSYNNAVSSQYNGGNMMEVNNQNADMMNMLMSNPNVTKCITEQPALTQMVVSADPTKAFFDVMYNYCSDTDSYNFKIALSKYEQCSGMNMNSFIETIGGAMIGTVMHCAQYITQLGMDVQQSQTFGRPPSFPLRRIPDQCVQAFIGDNPFGNMIRYYQEYPEADIHCFKEMYEALPDCTLNEWPIPIVGSFLKPISCIYGNSLSMLEEACRSELTALKTCLNVVSDITADTCNAIISECTKDINSFSPDPTKLAYHMLLPPPLLGMPLSDTCLRIAKQDAQNNNVFGFQTAVDNYEKFRTNCVPIEDTDIWDVKATKKDVITATNAKSKSTTAVFTTTTAEASSGKNKSGGGKFKTFVWGMFIGCVLFVVGLIGYGRHLNNTRYGGVGGNGVQIGPVQFGGPYNMLELTDANEIRLT